MNRRTFLTSTLAASAAAGLAPLPAWAKEKGAGMKLGLVTYLWGKDMDLPTLIDACEKSGLGGVEVRTMHKHGVEPSLSKEQRAEVKKRFADSPVTLVGYGSNAQFHDKDPKKLEKNIEDTKKFIDLMHDCGGSGVKVKPNAFVKDVPKEKTIEQIGKSLNIVAAYGADKGQQIRVECHGRGTSELPVMKAIFDVADHKNATVCWNSNSCDTAGEGLEHNFNLVKDRFGAIAHIRELDVGNYPYQELMNLFVKMDYQGWILLECRTNPKDKIAAMKKQHEVFNKMIGRK